MCIRLVLRLEMTYQRRDTRDWTTSLMRGELQPDKGRVSLSFEVANSPSPTQRSFTHLWSESKVISQGECKKANESFIVGLRSLGYRFDSGNKRQKNVTGINLLLQFDCLTVDSLDMYSQTTYLATVPPAKRLRFLFHHNHFLNFSYKLWKTKKIYLQFVIKKGEQKTKNESQHR